MTIGEGYDMKIGTKIKVNGKIAKLIQKNEDFGLFLFDNGHKVTMRLNRIANKDIFNEVTQ